MRAQNYLRFDFIQIRQQFHVNYGGFFKFFASSDTFLEKEKRLQPGIFFYQKQWILLLTYCDHAIYNISHYSLGPFGTSICRYLFNTQYFPEHIKTSD